MSGVILLAEDEALPRRNIARVLEEEGYRVHEAANGTEAIETIDEIDLDLVVTDLKMPGADGIRVIKHVRKTCPQTFAMLITAYASVETAVEALRLGAQDYLFKPVVIDDLLHKIRHLFDYKELAWENQMLRRELNERTELSNIVGESEAFREITELIEKVAPSSSNVLIVGESGVGKEVVARAIHHQSDRANKVFLAVNCSAIPETLLEAQLFGHVKGAFTGAATSQEGLFQRARDGTIFLDEIGDMPQTLQPKILRAIEEKEVLAVGSSDPIKVDVRVIAATNRDLTKEVEEGRFREDLYYRLNVISIRVPPLRERRSDIPLLVEHLMARHNREMKKAYKGVDNMAMKTLMVLPWKGNIRELDNVLERAMILGDGDWITAADLPQAESDNKEERENEQVSHNLKEALRAYEKTHIENVLRETGDDRTRAAELLGLSRSSLYRKLEKLRIGTE